VIAALALAIPTTALAQKEQWLDYFTTEQGRGYKYIELSSNAPPNVALPKFTSQPFFGKWVTPMDPAGRWVCFDRAGKSGPYNRLFIDSTGKGKLDEQQAIVSDRIEQYGSYFNKVRVVLKGPDGPCTYHLAFRFMNYGQGIPRLLVSSAGYYAGSVDFGGKKRRVELADVNVNGTFNDQSFTPNDADRIQITGLSNPNRSLGRMVEVDGDYYDIEVARDGACIKVQKAKDVAMGKVLVPDTIKEFVALGEPGNFFRKPSKGEAALPVGKYRVSGWTIDRKDSKGAKWQMSGNNFSSAADFEVAADKPVSLKLGEPIRMVVNPDNLTNEVAFDLSFQGQYGEKVSIERGNEYPPGPRLALASTDGTYRSTNTFEFG
jgi:hypothetical protein